MTTIEFKREVEEILDLILDKIKQSDIEKHKNYTNVTKEIDNKLIMLRMSEIKD